MEYGAWEIGNFLCIWNLRNERHITPRMSNYYSYLLTGPMRLIHGV